MEQAELSLYDDDFYAWTQQQAALLRAMTPASNRLDCELIAEEIEDLGRSEVRSAQSLCEHIIEHFLKLQYNGRSEPAGHWRREIVEWRLRLEKTLTRTVIAELELPQRYRAALRLLRREVPEIPGLAERAPAHCPYTLEQIIGSDDEDWFPDQG